MTDELTEAFATIKRLRKERNALIRICLDEGLKFEQLKDAVRSIEPQTIQVTLEGATYTKEQVAELVREIIREVEDGH